MLQSTDETTLTHNASAAEYTAETHGVDVQRLPCEDTPQSNGGPNQPSRFLRFLLRALAAWSA